MVRILELFRSGLVGLVATLVDLATLWLLVEIFGWGPASANVPALAVGVLVQFFGNKYFAFRDLSSDYLRQGTLFVLVEIGAFLLNALVFHLFVSLTQIPYLLARILGASVVYFGFSFPFWRLIFRPIACFQGE
ncbi:MAG: GtrA family protein [Pseudomonadota bacterium]